MPMTLNLSTRICQMVLTSFVVAICLSACKKPAEAVIEEEPVDSIAEPEFVSIFNGTSLDGWTGDTTYWRAENGVLIGEVTPQTLLKSNTFIVWNGGTPGDFELKLEFKIAEAGNSGVNYRSVVFPDVPFALRGYQADIDGKVNYTGQNYEERGRTTLAYRGEQATIQSQENAQDPESLKAAVKNNAWTKRDVTGTLGHPDSLRAIVKKGDWNSCHIIARGNHLEHYINGILMSAVTDEDTVNRKMSGLIGVQVHVGPPMTVEYRNIMLKQFN